jgi:precorrin-3B methylase
MSTNDANANARSPEKVLEMIEQAINFASTNAFSKNGQLMVVGGGIRAISDMTLDAEGQIRVADKVLYCVADPVTERRLHALNKTAESLYDLYGNDKPRMKTYNEMIDKILEPVRAGLRVCVVFYGHPGVFAWSTHQAIRIARREGCRAEMRAGISADASLFADIGIDPSSHGCHSLEATDFLIRQRTPDVGAHFLLWQVECVGDFGFNFAGYRRHNFHILIERLRMFYPAAHPVIIYQATQLPQGRPQIIKSSLDIITSDKLTGIATLYLPPVEIHKVDAAMCERLGLFPKSNKQADLDDVGSLHPSACAL